MAFSATAKEIDVSVDATLERFNKEILVADSFIKKAKGVLIFPQVIKAGFGIGGEYGEGAMRIGAKTVEYYVPWGFDRVSAGCSDKIHHSGIYQAGCIEGF